MAGFDATLHQLEHPGCLIGPQANFQTLGCVIPELDERQRQQALSVCQKISGHSARARTLLAIAKFLPPKQKNGAVTNAISSARLIKEDVVSALNLATTLPHVHGAQYNQILGEVQGIAANIDNSRSYLAILAKLMQFLADPEKSAIRKKILKQLQKLEQNPVNEMSFLEVAMNSLDEHFISMALDCLIKLSPNHLSIASIWDMTIHIGKELNDKHIQMILGFLNRSRPIRKINRPIDNELRIRIYCNLIDRIPEAILDQIWALAHSEILHIHSRVDLFRALGLVCDEEKLNWLLECIAGIEDVGSRSHAIAPACSNMTSRQALRALELCQEIGDFNELIIATLVCSKELGDSDFIRAISDTQAHATSISQPYDRAIFLVELATHLEGTLRETLIAEAESAYAVGNTRADHLQAKILVLRAPLLVGASLGKAFEEASKYSAPAHRATVIRALASKLSMEQVESTLRAIDKLEGTYSQPKASTVAALASRLDGDSRDKYMRRALAWANESDDHSRVTAWADLAAAFDDELGPDLRRKSLELAQSLDSPRSQASALSYILPILSVSEAEEALASFMDVAPSLKRDGLLTTIVPFVPYLAQRWGLPAIAELRRAILDCRDWYP